MAEKLDDLREQLGEEEYSRYLDTVFSSKSEETTTVEAASSPERRRGWTKEASSSFDEDRTHSRWEKTTLHKGAAHKRVFEEHGEFPAKNSHLNAHNFTMREQSDPGEDFYLSLPFPWDVVPWRTAGPKKADQVQQDYAGGEIPTARSWYDAVERFFIAQVHSIKCIILVKATMLKRLRDLSNPDVANIFRGLSVTAEDYRTIIIRFEKRFGAPLDLVTQAHNVLDTFRRINTTNYRSIDIVVVNMETHIKQRNRLDRRDSYLSNETFMHIKRKMYKEQYL
jgi:hypothetical protein